MLLNVDFSFYLLEITLIVIFSNVIISSHYTTEIIVFTHFIVMRTVSSVFWVLKKYLTLIQLLEKSKFNEELY